MDWDLNLSHYKQRPFKEVVKELAEFVWIRIQETQLNQVASSLTLTSVLSLVPLVAVILVSFAVFPAFAERRAEMEQLLFSSLLPEVYSQQIIGYVKSFAEHAQGLTIYGLAGFTINSLLLIYTVFATLNRIFHVSQSCSALERL